MDRVQGAKIVIAYIAGMVTMLVIWNFPTPNAPTASTPAAKAVPAPTSSLAPAKSSLSAADRIKICKTYAEYAKNTMKARQNGVEMSKIVEIFTSSGEPDHIIQEMIIKAYESPRMSVEENKERQVRDFENQYFLECTKGLGSS